jgi:hypothetical protein
MCSLVHARRVVSDLHPEIESEGFDVNVKIEIDKDFVDKNFVIFSPKKLVRTTPFFRAVFIRFVASARPVAPSHMDTARRNSF